MRKRAEKFLGGFGYYLTIFFCLAVILLSAVYARREDETRAPSAPIAADNGERLSDVLFGETPPPLETYGAATKSGVIARAYADSPEYFPAVGLWRAHRAVDYLALAGEDVFAVASGHIESIGGDTLSVRHEDGSAAQYVGIESVLFAQGDAIQKGDALGKATGRVVGEGENILHVLVESSGGAPVNFME